MKWKWRPPSAEDAPAPSESAYTPEQFDALVADALADLPAEFRDRLSNIGVEVQDWPSRQDHARAGVGPGRTLLGLYYGIPLTARDQGYNLVMPDRIILFRRPIEAAGGTPEGIRRQIRRTVLHEIAHHFGISDARLRELDAY
jgi:predicted Zn-dependent protease with MMP-like domain